MAEQFDLDAITADDALLDLLAAGDASALGGLGKVEDDPAIHLLAELRLAVEVDEPSFEMVDDAEAFLAACAARTQDPFARRVATRALVAGIAAVAALSVSGVAAAVTGNPLSPYEKVIERVVQEFSPRSSFPVRSLDGVVGSKAKAVKASKDMARDLKSRTGTGDNAVRQASHSDPLSNRVTQPVQVPPQLPPKPDNEPKPPLEQENQPAEAGGPQETEQPPPVQPSQPVPPTTQPTQQPTTTTTPTPTPTPSATTTTEAPADPNAQETTGTQGTQGGETGTTGTNGTQGSTQPQQTVVPTQAPPGAGPGADRPGEDGPDGDQTGDDQDGMPDDPGQSGDHDGTADQGTDRNGQHQPVEDPFTAALIRSILAMLNGVMVTPHG